MKTIWPEDRHPAEDDDKRPRTIEEIVRLFPPRNASSVSDKQAFYMLMLMPNGDLIGDECNGRGHFNHSVILGLENYKNQTAFYGQHGALRIDIFKSLYVDVMCPPTEAQRLAVGRMHREIGELKMAWRIDWLPDKTNRTEGTLQQFFQELKKKKRGSEGSQIGRRCDRR